MTVPAGYDPHCRLCVIAADAAATGERDRVVPVDDGTVVVHVGAHTMVLVRPGRPEALVAPVVHAPNLSALSPRDLPQILAATRRVALVVQSKEGGTSVERTEELPGAAGHVCIRVVPDPLVDPARFEDAAAFTRELRERFVAEG